MLKRVKNETQFVDFCFYLSIAVLPFTLILFPIAIGLLVAVFLVLGDKKHFLNRFKRKTTVWVLIAFYIFHVLGLFYSTDLGINFSRVDTQLFLLFIPIVFLSLNLKLGQIHNAKKVFIVSCTAFCVLALLTLVYNLIYNFEHRTDYNFVQTSMYHYHYPYDVLYINIAYILLIFNSYFNRLKVFISILFFTVIVLSGTRMGLAIFLLISSINLIINYKKFLNIKSLIILLGIFILSVILIKNSRYVNDKFFDTLSKIGFNTEQYVSNIGEQYHKLTLREKLWGSAKEAFKRNTNKLIGYGPQGSREVLNSIYKESQYNINGMNSHNQYLTTALNNGIFGVLILITIFVSGIISSAKSKSIQNMLVTVIIAIAFITESMLERQKGVAIFAIFLTLILLDNYKLIKTKQL